MDLMENERTSTNFNLGKKMSTRQRTPLGPISTNKDRNLMPLQKPRQKFNYPDKLFYAGLATLGEGPRDKIKKQTRTDQRENISRAVCALLNSGGGIVVVESQSENFKYNNDGLGPDIEEKLAELVCHSTTQDYYDVTQFKSFLLIFVKTWITQKKHPALCTLDTGLYIRSFTLKKTANVMQVMSLIEKKTSGKGKRARHLTIPSFEVIESLLEKQHLCLGEQLEISESDCVEFKDFATGNLEKRIKEVINPYFSAFGNSNGGYLIIGIGDQTKIVTGCGRESNKKELETLISKALDNKKIVHFKKCNAEDTFYTLTIKDVMDKDKHSGYVIFLEVKPFCCLGFVEDPQSWILGFDPTLYEVGDKQAKQLTASEWVKKMTEKDSDFITSEAPSLESQFERLMIGNRPPLAMVVHTKKGFEPLQKVQNNLFGRVEKGLTIKPDKLYAALTAEHPELEELLRSVILDAEGVLIVSRSWAVDLEQKSNPNVVCDVLLLSPGNYPKLYSVIKAKVSQMEFEYSRLIAFTLKQKLVNMGGYTGRLCVIPAVLHLKTENSISSFSWPDIQYPETYKLDDFNSVKELLQSLSIVMLSFRSFLSDRIGIEYFNLLTTEQYELLSRDFSVGPFFVHGPPGTGKTVVALKIIQRIKDTFHCSPKDILFLCENTPLRDYVRRKRICKAMTRVSFENWKSSRLRHIVVDEAQNFSSNNVNWFQKAKKLTSQHALWIFLDYFQACHNKDTCLPPCDKQVMAFLTKVVRSPEHIYKNMHEAMKHIASKSDPPILKELIEKSECCHGVNGFYGKSEHLKGEDIVKYVAETCMTYLSKGYSQGDIAVLCKTKCAADSYKPLLKDEMMRLRGKLRLIVKEFILAEDILKDAIIVDSVRRFAGLERCIVFAINPVCSEPEMNTNLFLCAASRATGNFHVLYESTNS